MESNYRILNDYEEPMIGTLCDFCYKIAVNELYTVHNDKVICHKCEKRRNKLIEQENKRLLNA